MRVKVWSETEYQRRFRLSDQYKELSEIACFSYYAERFGATQDRYERPEPARIETNKLQEGKSASTWNYYLCQHRITEVPDSTHTILTRLPCGKCAVGIIEEAQKELEHQRRAACSLQRAACSWRPLAAPGGFQAQSGWELHFLLVSGGFLGG